METLYKFIFPVYLVSCIIYIHLHSSFAKEALSIEMNLLSHLQLLPNYLSSLVVFHLIKYSSKLTCLLPSPVANFYAFFLLFLFNMTASSDNESGEFYYS